MRNWGNHPNGLEGANDEWGWGAVLGTLLVLGIWSSEEDWLSICILKLLEIQLSL